MADQVKSPAANERAFPGYAPRVTSEFRASLLQFPLYGDESLISQAASIHPSVSPLVVVAGRLWSESARDFKDFKELLQLPVGGGLVSPFTTLERGSLLSLRASCDDAGIKPGDVWARITLTRGRTGGLFIPATLLQGYVSNFQDLGWPGSPIQSLHDGKGAIRHLDWTVTGGLVLRATVPTARRWRVITGRFLVVTSAVPGNRNATLAVASGARVPFASDGGAHAANLAIQYSLTPDITPGFAAVTANNVPIPFIGDLELRAGDFIEVSVNAAGAGDTMTGLGLVVREWYEP